MDTSVLTNHLLVIFSNECRLPFICKWFESDLECICLAGRKKRVAFQLTICALKKKKKFVLSNTVSLKPSSCKCRFSVCPDASILHVVNVIL